MAISICNYLYLMFKHSIRVFVKEHLIHCHVKCRYHFLGVRYQLTAQVGVELMQVSTVEVEEWLTDYTYLYTSNTQLIFTNPLSNSPLVHTHRYSEPTNRNCFLSAEILQRKNNILTNNQLTRVHLG